MGLSFGSQAERNAKEGLLPAQQPLLLELLEDRNLHTASRFRKPGSAKSPTTYTMLRTAQRGRAQWRDDCGLPVRTDGPKNQEGRTGKGSVNAAIIIQ